MRCLLSNSLFSYTCFQLKLMFMSKNPQAHPSVSTKGTARRAVKQAIVIHPSSPPPPYMSGKVFGTPSCLIDLHSPSRRIMYCTVCIQTSKQASKVQRPSKAQGSRISHRSSENQRQKEASVQRSYAHTPSPPCLASNITPCKW